MKTIWRKFKNWIIYIMVKGLRKKLDANGDDIITSHEVENVVNGYLHPVYEKIADKLNKKL